MELLRVSAARGASRWQRLAVRPSNGTCRRCIRSQVAARRQFATTRPALEKPYYVTTPIFYVNAAPHVGHMYSMVLADVLKRWQTLTGRTALLCTGTDEHGIKVQRAAALEEVPPKQFCDDNAAKFEHLAEKALIDHDRFIRTTDEDHIAAVEYFWFLLREKGLIYESKHAGWYCVSDECFYPEAMIEKKQDPFTGQVFLASTETGNKVEWIEERNYHFRMTALKDKLLDFYAKNPDWIVPVSRMNEVVDWVQNHLVDLSISRPVDRLSWGIRVPGDHTQTIYVWVDALINYLTMAGFPNWTPGKEQDGGWPADVHVIGKDILRFHCVYWPALLLALDLPLPQRVLSHAHWTMDRRKMSKSLGNVVNPLFAIDRWGVDAMRFYMIYNGGIVEDSDYNNDTLLGGYKKLLQGGLGNLTNRIIRSKKWSVKEAITFVRGRGSLQDDVKGDKIMSNQVALLQSLGPKANEEMAVPNPSAALHRIMEVMTKANFLVSEKKPWELANEPSNPDKVMALNYSLYLAMETLRIVGILLQPFMPSKAAELLDILGVSEDKRTFQHAQVGADFDFGAPFLEEGKSAWETLFPPVLALN
ncbi:methionyl-tRNA synthetase [Echria macrotheca]|uniref:Probable methionine--tRNA ligase, mitochondrial n=1 Tax=Echria macrotheca TaxID=438768 RepID=A0AAJ0BP94_9PEZI|nr:methionyl-tRNA synthetase [Echria macrotheca]